MRLNELREWQTPQITQQHLLKLVKHLIKDTSLEKELSHYYRRIHYEIQRFFVLESTDRDIYQETINRLKKEATELSNLVHPVLFRSLPINLPFLDVHKLLDPAPDVKSKRERTEANSTTLGALSLIEAESIF
jgi:hypothetical protein